MPDVITSMSGVLTKLPINTTGLIGAQDMRDAVVSMYSGREVNVLEYGANPAGVGDSKAAFQNAIDDMHAAGGGSVLVPPGSYVIANGNISMKSDVTLIGASPSRAPILTRSGSSTSCLIGIASGPVVRANLVNIILDCAGSTQPAYGFLASAVDDGSGTGGWWDSAMIDVEIRNFDNGVYLRGAATGTGLSIQGIMMTRVVVTRTSGRSGSCVWLSGDVQNIQMDSCTFSGGISTNRVGTGVNLSRNGLPAAPYNVPTSIEMSSCSIVNANTACSIGNGQSVTFKNTWVENMYYGFTVVGAVASIPSESIRLINPRFVNVASVAEIAGAWAIKAGAFSRVHATDIWYAGTCLLPFVNASSRGFSLEFSTNSGQTSFNGLTSGLTPSLAVTGSGTAGLLDLAGHKTVKVTGSAVSVSHINSQLLPGESVTGFASGTSLLFNTTDAQTNIKLPGGVTSCLIDVNGPFKITCLDAYAGVDYLVEFLPVSQTVAALPVSPTLTDVINKTNELILALQNGRVMS